MKVSRFPLLLPLIVLPFSSHADTHDGKLSLSTGATYTSGDYGTADTTDILYIPVSLKYKKDRWHLKLTVPYLRIDGPQNVIRDIGQVSQTTMQRDVISEGLGDISLSAGYQFLYLPKSKTLLDVNGKIKFGTADEDKSLGTGKTDYSLSFGAYELLGDYTPYLTLGRKFYGNSPRFQLEDVFFGSLGLGYKVSDKTQIGVDLYVKERTADWRSTTRQLSAYGSYKLDRNWKVQGHFIRGLSENTPDLGGGFSVNYQFD